MSDFVKFTTRYWAVVSIIPILIIIMSGLKDFVRTGGLWWYAFVTIIYIIACIAETGANKKLDND